MLPFEKSFKNRRVLVTGHTGFKGSWLALWLKQLGADVYGISLRPETEPNLFDAVGLAKLMNHHEQDIRDREAITQKIIEINPEIIFHLAAQPLVRRSYDQPLETFETNTLGTAYILDACKQAGHTKAIVCVTTDKVYANEETNHAYLETDPLGGKDPYSASKAAAEIVAASYQHLFNAEHTGIAMATARGGNVIGGGDWSEDRLVPDLARAIAGKQTLVIRNPNATRPWQHVLALCHGYLQLADALLSFPDRHCEAWNFGPDESGVVTVAELLNCFDKNWVLQKIVTEKAIGKPESQLLNIDSTKSRRSLCWQPAWSFEKTVGETASWYKSFYASPTDARDITLQQISAYRNAVLENAQ